MSDMARRVTIRLDDSSQALLEAEAVARGVSLGGLIRESAVRAARDVGREVSAGRVKLRARSASQVPVPAVAGRIPSAGLEEASSVVQPAVAQSGAGSALPAAAPRAPGVASRSEIEPVLDPGVARAIAFRRAARRA